MGKRVKVTRESETGRNQQFQVIGTGQTMPRRNFVRRIEQGEFPDYHIRVIKGVKTPASDPNKSEADNLG